jgi:hypothetical protein
MWRTRRDNAPESFQGAVPPAGPEIARGQARRGWRGLFGRRRRNAWRVDRAPASQVAWANVPELTPRAAQAHVVSGLSPFPADERLDHDMPRVYCPRCGQENPEGARFCSHCGLALGRAGGERAGESTSTISLGTELAEAEPDEPLADSGLVEALPGGRALRVVKRRAQRGQPVPARQRSHHGRPAPGERHLSRRRDGVPPPRGVLPAPARLHRA